MRENFEKAISNIVRHGDTDIFPFPIENHILHDSKEEALDLLSAYFISFKEKFASNPPAHESTLSPAGYTGFRWATQLDPLWNAFFLGLVVAIAQEIEQARISIDEKTVFSYRFHYDDETAHLFRKNIGWRQFMERSIELAEGHSHVVLCDIADFYPRLGHHRLDNALKQLKIKSDVPSKIMAFLDNFSNTRSFGLPIGGPAARILSELVLNQVDRLLAANGIKFCRFADDYHVFANSQEEAYSALIFLSDKLFTNEGLSLQKAKTRILSGAEFVATNPLSESDESEEDETRSSAKQQDLEQQAQSLMRFSLRFDPYSTTAQDDYQDLKRELSRFDILGLLRSELSKSRIHIALAKRISSAIKYLDAPQKSDAIISLVNNADTLSPIFPTVMTVIRASFEDLDEGTQKRVCEKLRSLINSGSHITKVELNLAYVVRILGLLKIPENVEIMTSVFHASASSLVRRDIILIMAKWNEWYWTSDLRNRFRTLTPSERRAFIVASYTLSDEGRHWRSSINPELSEFEYLVRMWAKTRSERPGWSIPI